MVQRGQVQNCEVRSVNRAPSVEVALVVEVGRGLWCSGRFHGGLRVQRGLCGSEWRRGRRRFDGGRRGEAAAGVVEVVEERLRRWEAGDADEERRVSLALTDLRMLLNAND